MQLSVLLFFHFSASIPLVNLFLDDIPDLNLETSSPSSDLFSVPPDSEFFPEDESASGFLLADNNFCQSDNADFTLTSKIRIRDSCASTDSDPTLTTPTLNQANLRVSDNLPLRERKRLYKLFGLDSSNTLMDGNKNDLCPLDTTFGSMLPVCDSGSWADAVPQAGGGYTLFHIRPYIPLLPCQDPSFLWCCASVRFYRPPTVSSLLDPLLDFSVGLDRTGLVLPVGYTCYNPTGQPINRNADRMLAPGPPKA